MGAARIKFHSTYATHIGGKTGENPTNLSGLSGKIQP